MSARGIAVLGAALWALCMAGCASSPPASGLDVAIYKNDMQQFRAEIARGANLSQRDAMGYTPLHHALLKERREMALELIRRGADLNSRTLDGSTPLMMAIKSGYVGIINELLDRHAVVEPPAYGQSPLFTAIRANVPEVLEKLLAHGARIERRNYDGETPLYFAASIGYAPVVQRLLDRGADIDAATPDGQTALHAALLNKHEDVADLLYSRKAAVREAEGEVGAFSTALVFRFAARKEYGRRDMARSREYLGRAQTAFVAAQSQVDDRAREYSAKVWKVRTLNVVSLMLAQAQANLQAQTSLTGTGSGTAWLGSTASDSERRDAYRNLSTWLASEAQRMGKLRDCVAADAAAAHDCFRGATK